LSGASLTPSLLTRTCELPANQSQSGIKSRSSKGGTANNFNELRFEDKKGEEELHLQAEKDMSTLVKHDQTSNVGADRTITVGNDETNHVGADRSLWVQEDDKVAIGSTHTKIITGAVTQMFGDNHKRDVTGEQKLSEAQNKEELVKLAYKLTTDVKFRLNQPNSIFVTFVTVSVAGRPVFLLRLGCPRLWKRPQRRLKMRRSMCLSCRHATWATLRAWRPFPSPVGWKPC
jgi:hypothetical protein